MIRANKILASSVIILAIANSAFGGLTIYFHGGTDGEDPTRYFLTPFGQSTLKVAPPETDFWEVRQRYLGGVLSNQLVLLSGDPATAVEHVVLGNWQTHAWGQIGGTLVGESFANFLFAERPEWFRGPIDAIGHSRGGGLIYDFAKVLGRRNIGVEGLHFMDNHPVNGVAPQPYGLISWGDSVPTHLDNVGFAVNYMQRNDVNIPGKTVEGAWNLDISSSGLDHLGVVSYFHGTIDLDSVSVVSAYNGGTRPVNNAWYAGQNGPRDSIGFHLTHLGEGRHEQSLAGTHPVLGGTGVVKPITGQTTEGAWPWIGLANQTRQALQTGAATVEFAYSDPDTPVTLDVYLGDDRDPTSGSLLYTKSLPAAAERTRLSLDLAIPPDVPSGFLHFVLNDGTNVKYTSAQFPPGPIGWNLNADGDWSRAANWKVPVPNATDAKAFFGAVTTAPRTVAADVPVTVGRIAFDSPNSYTIAGHGALTFNVAIGNGTIDVARGNHVISAPVTLADNTLVTISATNSNLSFTGGVSGPGALGKAGPGSMTLTSFRLRSLSILEGPVTLREGSGVSVLGALAVAHTPTRPAKLDVTNNPSIIDYSGTSPEATVRAQILTGRGGSGLGKTWNGNGITSSTAATANATNADARSLGYADNAALPLGQYTAFRGQPVDETSLLMAYTRTGDANLDGVVNDDDVTIVGATYAPGVPQPFWALGDFDYNGFVDDDDVTLLGVFYNPSAAPLVASVPSSAAAVAAVPEPSTWALAACGFLCAALVIKKRRKKM